MALQFGDIRNLLSKQFFAIRPYRVRKGLLLSGWVTRRGALGSGMKENVLIGEAGLDVEPDQTVGSD